MFTMIDQILNSEKEDEEESFENDQFSIHLAECIFCSGCQVVFKRNNKMMCPKCRSSNSTVYLSKWVNLIDDSGQILNDSTE